MEVGQIANGGVGLTVLHSGIVLAVDIVGVRVLRSFVWSLITENVLYQLYVLCCLEMLPATCT
jgi:hypothetical protein